MSSSAEPPPNTLTALLKDVRPMEHGPVHNLCGRPFEADMEGLVAAFDELAYHERLTRWQEELTRQATAATRTTLSLLR